MFIPFWQRFLSTFIYMLTWSEAIAFGRYLFIDFPFLKSLIIPALPIIFIQSLVPFGSLFLYILCFIFLIRNPKISYFIRYNTLQAILLNIALIIINFVFEILLQPFSNTLLARTFSSTIFILMLYIVIFSIFKSFEGKEPELPGISEAVKIQL